MEKINKITGLTPQQEQAVTLLATGQTVTEVAKALKVERCTIYQWAAKVNFQAYFNKLVSEIQASTKNNLFGLVDEAYKTLRESLNSKNESVKLKAALSIFDRVNGVEIGQTDPVKMLRGQCTTFTEWDVSLNETTFDEERFRNLMQDNCLED